MPSTSFGLYPGQVANLGTSSRTAGDAGPWIIQRARPCPAARPGNVRAGPACRGSVRRGVGGCRCPERPHPVPASRWV